MRLGKQILRLVMRCLRKRSRHGHHRIVELLLRSKRFSANAVDNSHMSPLHLAAIGGRVEVIRILLDCPDINVVRLSTRITIVRRMENGRLFFFSMPKTKMEKLL